MSGDIPPVCDYEGSDYKSRFWENKGRDYEDSVERIALRRLMPPKGGTLIDVGAGFGRLADEYQGYEKVVLFDYSRSLLREAQDHLGDDPRFIFVAGNWYEMPFVDGLFDAIVQVRTIHHAADVPSLFNELFRIVHPDGCYVLEFASKHNLKAMFRYAVRRQDWSPFAPEPVEFTELNFDFHPRYISDQLQYASFSPGETLTVSHFRLNALKQYIPTNILSSIDAFIQPTGKWWQLTPSVFVRSTAANAKMAAEDGTLFVCPKCRTPLDEPIADMLICENPDCGHVWRLTDGLYDFKEPVEVRSGTNNSV